MHSRICSISLTVVLLGGALLQAASPIHARVPGAESKLAPSEVRFTEIPVDHGFYARDKRNLAEMTIAGSMREAGYSSIEVQVWRDGIPWQTFSLPLVYGSTEEAPFSLTIEMEAGLFGYDLVVVGIAGRASIRLAEVQNIIVGDVYLVQGQSNAVAMDYHVEGLANRSQRSWIRSFGTSSLVPDDVANDLEWHLADGEGANCPGCVGAWALRMAQLIVDYRGIPVGLLNGAVGGTTINYHLRNDADPTDLTTNYGRLLFRARAAGIDSLARAMLWYQGESNGGTDPNVYLAAFKTLLSSWGEDYPGLERVYTFQVRDGCGSPTLTLRDMMRQFGDILPNVEVMSTTAAPGHDGCHFYYNGYRELGMRIARLVGLDFYGLPTDRDIRPPNPSTALFSDGNHDKVELYFRGANDTIVWGGGSEGYFELDDGSTVIGGEVIDGNVLLLYLDGPSAATTISYTGHSGDGPWVANGRGVGLLAFDSLPIE